MYQTKTGRYDEIPEGMKQYINNYGCHFNKKLCQEAISRMYKVVNGKKEYVQPYSKEQVEKILERYDEVPERGKLYDCIYVFHMGIADFFGRSIPSEEHLAKYVKDVIDDADAKEGYVFNRFYADSIFNNQPIEWDDMI